MLRSNKTTQFDGTSYITDGEGNEQTELYEENKTTVRADYTEFQTAVYTAQDAE